MVIDEYTIHVKVNDRKGLNRNAYYRINEWFSTKESVGHLIDRNSDL